MRLVMAGLAGSPQMISSTLLALTRLIYEFKGKFNQTSSVKLQVLVILMDQGNVKRVILNTESHLDIIVKT